MTSAAPVSRPRGSARVGRVVLIVLAAMLAAVQLGLAAGVVWAAQNPQEVSDRWTVARAEPTADAVALADRAGMSERGRFVFFASRPVVVEPARFDELCPADEPGIGVLGCYTLASQRIYLYPVTAPELDGLTVVVAAHEMLHAAWDRMTTDEQRALEGPLEEAFAALGPDHELVERIALYEAADPAARIPELYALLGSEVAELPAVLEEHYAGWFADRAATTSLYASATAVFRDFDARLVALEDDLDELGDVIDADRERYADEADALTADIEDFNARADTPGAFATEAEFEEERAEIIARQEALEADRIALNDAVDRYNELLAELEALNAEAAELNRAINIDAEPLPAEPAG